MTSRGEVDHEIDDNEYKISMCEEHSNQQSRNTLPSLSKRYVPGSLLGFSEYSRGVRASPLEKMV
jgi:hypothetical protein